ncbi:MAG: N-acetylmuramoyl-L-alanine amidase [Candidatus Falkowbacteria bacterium]
MKKTIILNAGHSINDPGAKTNITTEAQEAIKIRDKLVPLLKQNFEVVIVPDDLNLTDSIKWVNDRYSKLEDGLAFSVHLNAGGGHGAEIFYYEGSEESRRKAKIIIDKYCNLTSFRNRGVKPDTSSQHKEGLDWIKKVIPWSFLIECCFIDSVEDLKKLHEEYNEVAWAIYSGICLVYNVKPINPQQIDVVDEQVETKENLHPIKLTNMQYYGPDSLDANVIREYIGDEFHGRRDRLNLQCTEYAYYRLLCSDIKVEWERTSGRHGGLWPEAVSKKYKILDTPIKGGAMCIPLSVIPHYGHVAYIENVNSDQSINVAEANWGPNSNDIGHYWERTIRVEKWRDRYKAKFIDFK